MFKKFIAGDGIIDEVLDGGKYRVRFQSSIWNGHLKHTEARQPLAVGDKVRVVGFVNITLLMERLNAAN